MLITFLTTCSTKLVHYHTEVGCLHHSAITVHSNILNFMLMLLYAAKHVYLEVDVTSLDFNCKLVSKGSSNTEHLNIRLNLFIFTEIL